MISVDPSSPFTQGALLGDRIRLTDHFLDPGVFIRSMGTRGHLGGLAEATLQAMLVLDAAGKDLVFLETVGTGQSEVEVISIADTVVLVLMPGSGDSIQALKAGIMEIPDVIAINKMDHPLAKTMLNEVRQVLALDRDRDWTPPIVLTEAVRGEGVETLWEKIDEHRAWLEENGRLEERRRRNLAAEVFAVASLRAKRHLESAVSDDPELRRLLDEVQRRELDPLTAVQEILEKVFHIGTTTQPRRRSLTSRRRATASTGHARVTPVYGSETLSRRVGRDRLAEGGEPPADRLVQDPRRGQQARDARADGERAAASSPRAPATTARPSRGPRASSASRRRSSCRRTRRWRRSTRRGTTAPTPCSRAPASTRRWRRRASSVDELGATFVHAFEDEAVIAGQGTIGLELAEQLPDVETFVVPGRRRRARGRDRDRAPRPRARTCGSSASRRASSGQTIADGIAVKQPGELTTAILERDARRHRRTSTDDEITEAIMLLLERSKLVVEGAGAVGVAALLAGQGRRRAAPCARSSRAATSTRRC